VVTEAGVTVLDGQSPEAVRETARVLAAGELAGVPTETVYGLAARADRDEAVAKIFAAKGRPSDHPLIVHVLDEQGARVFAQDLPPVAHRLIEAFWPGPLTLIVRRVPGIAAAAAGGQESVGLRCPSHPVFRALMAQCRALGVEGLAAPSANRFGRVSPTTAAHVAGEFEPGLTVLDGGPCEVARRADAGAAGGRGRHGFTRPRRPGAAGLGHTRGALCAARDGAADVDRRAARRAGGRVSGGAGGIFPHVLRRDGRGAGAAAGDARAGAGRGAAAVRRPARAGRGRRDRDLDRGASAGGCLGWGAGPLVPRGGGLFAPLSFRDLESS
jgi:tRNA threonylcarbamoyl adenosine modification protein (Sua5/YciO/YrdC/YwlC family)